MAVDSAHVAGHHANDAGPAARPAREALRYPRVGGTSAPAIVDDVPAGFRASERTAPIGSGEHRWAFARREVLRWGVKTRSGFGVHGAGGGEQPVRVGDAAELRYRLPIGTLREPVRVVWVDDHARRAGFGYGTLPGHPLVGEEAFIVEWGDDDVVRFTVRAFARPSPRWWMLTPALALARRIIVRRYLRALAGRIDLSAA